MNIERTYIEEARRSAYTSGERVPSLHVTAENLTREEVLKGLFFALGEFAVADGEPGPWRDFAIATCQQIEMRSV